MQSSRVGSTFILRFTEGIIELVGEIFSGLITVWVTVSFINWVKPSGILKTIEKEMFPFVPFFLILWFGFSGDISSFGDTLRLFVISVSWAFEYKNNDDDRWKRRGKKMKEKVQAQFGKLIVVPTS